METRQCRYAAGATAILVALLHAGCASRAHAPSAVDLARAASIAEADALAAEGCYEPMDAALALYEAALAGVPDDAALRRRAFDVSVRLALRERRLGLFPGRHEASARRLAGGLDTPDVGFALEVIALVPWRHGTRPPDDPQNQSFAELRAHVRDVYEALVAQAGDDPQAAVLLMHLLAAFPFASLPPDAPLAGQRFGSPELDAWPWLRTHLQQPAIDLVWRDVRGTTPADDWAVLHLEHPRCHEALVFMADAELASRRMASADAALAAAVTTLPDLVPARVTRGRIHAEIGNDEEALVQFQHVTSRVPAHREAWLGALEALSRLGRRDEALAAADRLLALGEWYLGEAYYWKAWNLLQMRRLPEAHAAVAEARRLLHNADVHYLAGLVAYHDEAWETARKDLELAVKLEAAHCDARFTLGAVQLLEQTWAVADASFRMAEECFRSREPELAAAVAEVERSSFDEAHRAALRTRRQRALDVCRQQQQWARYNRAVALANQGQRDDARTLGEAVRDKGGPAGDAAADLLLQLESSARQAPPDGD